MKFLVIGQGGREHALVKALRNSKSVTEVHAAPGSAGMARDCVCHAVQVSDHIAVEKLVRDHKIDCVIVGPEVPLAEGLADFLRHRRIAVVGPDQAGARLESSKVFSKEFMTGAGVPSARYFMVDSVDECMSRSRAFQPPYVLKADGLAAGKGVFICKTIEELESAAESLFNARALGESGAKAVLEEFQPGEEVSYLVLTNGREYEPLPVSQDHKRLRDGDEGPNTGGMGVVGPVALDEGMRRRIHKEIVEPTLSHLSGGIVYRGVLYFGIMLTKSGPSLLEYNVRFGDPEAQVILPLLDGDWGEVFIRLANGELLPLRWKSQFVTCVVLASPGYPDAPKSVAVTGDLSSNSPLRYFLHAGTKSDGGRWLTCGGRVLNAIGIGSSLSESIRLAYEQAGQVSWEGIQMRRDIGTKQLGL